MEQSSAFNAGDPHSDIWVDELARGVRMRLTNDPGTDYGPPVWSPDGSRILFRHCGGKARLGIYQKNSNGAGGQELLLPAETSDPQIWPTSWSPDGRFILFVRGNYVTQYKISGSCLSPATANRASLSKTPLMGNSLLTAAGWLIPPVESGKAQVYVVPFDATKVLNTAPGP